MISCWKKSIKKNEKKLTPRNVSIYGLIAGIKYTEGRKLAPGYILDAFLMRHKYDASHRGL